MSNQAWTLYESPIGPLTIIGGDRGLSGVRFPGDRPRDERDRDDLALAPVAGQLAEYFAGGRRAFELEVDLRAAGGMERAVWHELQRIPYGETISYGGLAAAVGRPDRVRAVAAAVGRTPTPIVVPCHRVIGADGSLTGYGGGLDRKRALLELEGRVAAGLEPEPPWAFRQIALI